MCNLSRTYYLKPAKIIRDLVHGYVNVTKFELELIDTVHFQRLKDIRQLTCQHVYPSARHTRFEHSLGVLELTRRAIKNLNENGFIFASDDNAPVISEHLEFNATIAGLLHDVGHCPFSHLGEIEFNVEEIKALLCETIEATPELANSTLYQDIMSPHKKSGAPHEQLSCIVILNNYYDKLITLTQTALEEDDQCDIKIDFELIIRCILGIEYDVSTADLFKANKAKNAIVNLINSSVFDMDKLDYIMRDSLFTGIGTPVIDTQRLFRNMYYTEQYSLVFTSKAVPSLQNMIESRDGLYMYVYNHQAVIYSDFLNAYILRRLSHNARDFVKFAKPNLDSDELEFEIDNLLISALGLVPKPYLFSVQAVQEQARSDSDWTSLLNIIHYNSIQTGYLSNTETLIKALRGELLFYLEDDTDAYNAIINTPEEMKLVQNIQRTFELIHQYKTRVFLKPWWKTVFEFSNFMNQNFRDDRVRNQLCCWICIGGSLGLNALEFRSQIAKHVIYITQNIDKEKYGLFAELKDDEFFIVERTTRFFDPDTIQKIDVALKTNEMLTFPSESTDCIGDYYIKNLTNIIPQKDYSSIYAKNSFYVYSKALGEDICNSAARSMHYRVIEQIFVFVASEFVRRGEQDFVRLFGKSSDDNSLAKQVQCEESQKSMLKNFISNFPSFS